MKTSPILTTAAGAFAILVCVLAPSGTGWSAEKGQPQAAAQALRAAKAPMVAAARAGHRVVGVGDHGIVLLSDDEGRSWRQARSVPTRSLLTGVWFVDDSIGWAVGHGGVVLQSRDAGETWNVQHTADAELALLSVWFGDERHGIAVGSFGRALETRDGGESWRQIELGQGDDRDRHLNQIFAGAGDTLFVAAEAGTIFRSTDAGRSWKTLKPAYKGSFWNGMMLRDGSILVVGMRGNVFCSDDNGDTWHAVHTGTTQALSGMTQLADGRVVLVGMSGTLLVSTDGGRSFASRTRGDRLNMTSVAAMADGRVVLLGQSGVASDVIDR